MKANLNDFAEYSTRLVADLMDGSGTTFSRKRGWWAHDTGEYLGQNRSEAEDKYSISRQGYAFVEWNRDA